MKHCRDCKHYKPDRPGILHDARFDQCTYKRDTRFCDIERFHSRIMAWLLGYCGVGARFFEPKETPHDAP
jgi:hypothetical protein